MKRKFHLGDIVYPANLDNDCFVIDDEDIEDMKHIYGVITDYEDYAGERTYEVEWCDFSTHDRTEGYCPRNAWWYENELTRNQEKFLDILEENSSNEEEIEPLTEEELQFLKTMKILK